MKPEWEGKTPPEIVAYEFDKFAREKRENAPAARVARTDGPYRDRPPAVKRPCSPQSIDGGRLRKARSSLRTS